MNMLMLSCTKATELIEKKSIDGLSPKDSIRLSMHTAVCSACKQYERQSGLLNRALSQQINESPEYLKNNLHLETHSRIKIQQEIENNLKKM
jgi:predicted anti-sigma-YlaC factor YlaD